MKSMVTTIFATLTFDLFFLSPLSSFIKYEALHGRAFPQSAVQQIAIRFRCGTGRFENVAFIVFQ